MNRFSLLLLFVISLLTFGCSDDKDDNSSQAFENGFFICNEGGFGGGNASIDFYHFEGDSISRNIFTASNSRPLGDVAQSISIIGGYAYIVVNNSNKIEVVDVKDFTQVATVTGLAFPRHIIDAGNGKAYVSQWGADGLSGSIQILDLNTNTITDNISVPGFGPEKLSRQGDKVFVGYSGGYGVDNQICVIDINTDSVTDTISTKDNPVTVVPDAAGNLWVLSSGYFDFNDMQEYPAYLSQYGGSGYNEQKSFQLPYTYPNDLYLSGDGSQLYFILNNAIVAASANASNLEMTTIVEDASFYSMGYDPDNQRIVGGDANDYISAGTVKIYNENGTFLDSVTTGIIPGDFIFVK